MIQTLVTLFYGYALTGVFFGVYFIGWGAARLDNEARELPFTLRLLLLPGSIALWPLLGLKLLYHPSPSSGGSNSSLP